MKWRKMVNVGIVEFKTFLEHGGKLDTDDFPKWENCRWKLGDVYVWGTGENFPALIYEAELGLSYDTTCFISLKGMEKALELLEKTGMIRPAFDISCDDFIAIDKMGDKFIMLAMDNFQTFNIPEDEAREVGIIE